MPRKVLSARVLNGAEANFEQDEHELRVDVPMADRQTPVSVIELTINEPIKPGTLYGSARMITTSMTEYGHILSEKASPYDRSVRWSHDNQENHVKLFRGERSETGFAVHTEPEENPWVFINLHEARNVKAVVIENRPGERRTDGLILSISEDGENWEEVWKASNWEEKWLAVITHFHAGIEVPGRKAQFLKFETRGAPPKPMRLQRITVFGE